MKSPLPHYNIIKFAILTETEGNCSTTVCCRRRRIGVPMLCHGCFAGGVLTALEAHFCGVWCSPKKQENNLSNSVNTSCNNHYRTCCVPSKLGSVCCWIVAARANLSATSSTSFTRAALVLCTFSTRVEHFLHVQWLLHWWTIDRKQTQWVRNSPSCSWWC